MNVRIWNTHFQNISFPLRTLSSVSFCYVQIWERLVFIMHMFEVLVFKTLAFITYIPNVHCGALNFQNINLSIMCAVTSYIPNHWFSHSKINNNVPITYILMSCL